MLLFNIICCGIRLIYNILSNVFIYILFFSFIYKLSVPTKVGVTQPRYMTHAARCMCGACTAPAESGDIWDAVHIRVGTQKFFRFRPMPRRECRLYWRGVLSGFARGFHHRAYLAITPRDRS